MVPMSAHACYLRVYEPLSAFPPPTRARWQRALASGRTPTRVEAAWLEHRQGTGALLSRPDVVAPLGADSRLARLPAAAGDLLDLLLVDTTSPVAVEDPRAVLVCPLRTRLRSWRVLDEVRDAVPGAVADVVVPPATAEAARRELARWQGAGADLRSHVLTSTWAVPLRWFAVVDEADRRTLTGPRHTGGGLPVPGTTAERSVVFRSRMTQARRRVARAHEVLSAGVEDGPELAGLAELARWLGGFHLSSLVELDYGGLVHLMDDDALAEDSSAADVAGALAALARGDSETASRCYERVADRWQAYQHRELAN